MADGDTQLLGKKMKPEHLSISAIILAIVTGTGGLGLNVYSNRDVATKLEALTLTMTTFDGRLKASEKLEAKIDRQQESIDKLKEESAQLHEAIHVLEVKEKK